MIKKSNINKLRQIIKEELNKNINEGFMNYSVGGSDSAADLWSNCIDKIVPVLKRGLKDRGNEYNTTGPQNVAMILIEKLKNNIEELSDLKDLTIEALSKENYKQSEKFISKLENL